MLPILFPFRLVAANLKHRKILGETIRSYRKTAEMSQEKLAEKADLHHNYVGELERGEKAASIDTLVKVAKALDVHARDLLKDL
jgi:transcriptional regulator with XRE-family HTH domain